MSTKKEKCNHDEFAQGQIGEECLECGLLRSTVESIGGHSQSESIEWDDEFEVLWKHHLDWVGSGFRYNDASFTATGLAETKPKFKALISRAITTAVAKREKEIAELVENKKFKLGERLWCVECAQRISKFILKH